MPSSMQNAGIQNLAAEYAVRLQNEASSSLAYRTTPMSEAIMLKACKLDPMANQPQCQFRQARILR